MADFPPSESRRREARAAGRVAHSPILTASGALAGGALALWLGGRQSGALLVEFTRRMLGGAGAEPMVAVGEALSLLTRVVLPVALAALAGALLAGLVQTRGLFTFGAFGRRGRDPSRSLPSVPWALMSVLVLLLVLGAREIGAALGAAATVTEARVAVLDAAAGLVPRALILLVAAGLGDWAWRRIRLERSLWMSRAERERERRAEQGDPRLRAEARRRQRAS